MNELQEIRHTLGLTQTELAARLGVRQSTVSRWERGDLPLDARTLLAARALRAEAPAAAESAA